MGNGTNPQDIVFVNAKQSLREPSGLTDALHPQSHDALQKTGELNLSSPIKPNDLDGSPEPAYMLIRNGLVYVALQHIDFSQSLLPKVANGEVVVINPATDSIVTVITLQGRNPLSELQYSPTHNRILVSSVGNCGH